ncbi:MAG: hypothetical protein LWY06_11530 [Firmicutes bacterium]|nr:hypothetical protein [Bacillota bacterium]
MKLISFRDVFTADPEQSSIILVEGAAGTLKSALCFSLMLETLKDKEDAGLYLTFEQTWESHLRNMKSLGLESPENLLVSDYNFMRKEFRDEEMNINIFDSILGMVEALKSEKKDHFKIFALDSLNALYSILSHDNLENAKISFFRRLKSLGVITLLIFEKTTEQDRKNLRERFLADGIISLGIMHNKGDVVRYLQPVKLTSSEHSLKRRQMAAKSDGLALLGPFYR